MIHSNCIYSDGLYEICRPSVTHASARIYKHSMLQNNENINYTFCAFFTYLSNSTEGATANSLRATTRPQQEQNAPVGATTNSLRATTTPQQKQSAPSGENTNSLRATTAPIGGNFNSLGLLLTLPNCLHS